MQPWAPETEQPLVKQMRLTKASSVPVTAVPPVLAAHTDCSTLQWRFGQLGWPEVPLQFGNPGMESLTELHLEGNRLFIDLPLSLLLRKLYVRAEVVIIVSDEIIELMYNLESLSILYCQIQGRGVVNMLSVLQHFGKTYWAGRLIRPAG